ncbi:MAG: tetratricopeptide repeat protein, partial [Myxococcales bacterium]|nr:tetratricopeptide repeat protein [Myxococcales bacterium]
SFCVALYEALYRIRPFPGRAVAEIRRSILKRRLREPPSDTRVPTWVRRAVERGLSVDPAARFESMEALIEALDPAPRRARVRVALAGGVALMALAGALIYRQLLINNFERQVEEASGRSRCTGASARVDEVWNDARREELKRAALSTGLSFAEGVWERVEARLDGYASSWATMYTRACEATHVDGSQSSELLDLRVACLEGRMRELTAMVEVLAHADATVVEHAVQAAAGLPSVDRCADTRALLERVAPPDDPAAAAEVQQLRGLLAESNARGQAGQLREALQRAELALPRAERLEYRPLLGEVLLQIGDFAEGLGEYERATAALREAYWHALAMRDDGLAGRSASVLVHVMAVQGKLDDAVTWSRHADAVLDRVELDAPEATLEHRAGLANHVATVRVQQDELEQAIASYRAALAGFSAALGAQDYRVASVHNNLGNTLARTLELEEATRHFDAARQIYERELGPGHPLVAVALNNLGEGYVRREEFKRAEEAYERALAILRETVGDGHINVGVVHNNIGDVTLQQGLHDRAIEHFRVAIKIFEDNLGPDDENLGFPLSGLGETRLALGDVAGAVAALERAVRVRTGGTVSPYNQARTQLALARALWRSSDAAETRGRALELADAAIAGFEASGPRGQKPGEEARSWRAAPGGG